MIDGIFAATKAGVTVSRSRSVSTMAGATQQPPSFSSAPPKLEASAAELSLSHKLEDASLVKASKLRAGIRFEGPSPIAYSHSAAIQARRRGP